MFSLTPMRRIALTTASLAALALVAPQPALSARGGKQETQINASLTLRDDATDTIRSDGQGGYPANVALDRVTMETGKQRGMFIDLSNAGPDGDASTIPSSDAGNVSMIINSAGGVSLEFTSSRGRWLLRSFDLSVTKTDTDGDGVIDRYEYEDDGSQPSYLYKLLGTGFGRNSSATEYHGTYYMKWSARVDVNP